MAFPVEAFDSSDFPSNSKWWSEETVAVVTGSNKGIGYAFAKRLAELGLTVVLAARDVGKGQAAVESLHACQLRAVMFRQLDVTDHESVESFALWIRDRFGGLDILVNNAGVSFNKIYENSVEHAETVIKTNFYGTKRLIEALLPLFRRASSTSRILNLSSQLGLLNKLRNPDVKKTLEDERNLSEQQIEEVVIRFLSQVKDGTWEEEGWPKVWTDYSLSKLALNAYSRVMARRHEGRGLSINCYCPGFTRTDMTDGQGSHSAEEAAEVGAKIVLLHPTHLPTSKFFKWSRRSLSSKL